jgi:hypothetical protein
MLYPDVHTVPACLGGGDEDIIEEMSGLYVKVKMRK